jgi:hypothetical protein
VYLLQHAVLDHADPRLARRHVDQDFFAHCLLPEIDHLYSGCGRNLSMNHFAGSASARLSARFGRSIVVIDVESPAGIHTHGNACAVGFGPSAKQRGRVALS